MVDQQIDEEQDESVVVEQQIDEEQDEPTKHSLLACKIVF